MKGSKVILAKGQNLNWHTPPDLFNQLNNEFHFALDAATSEDNPLKTPLFYTEADNGLKLPWYNVSYCNPPYSSKNIIPWLIKARIEQSNNITSVFLLPARTSTNWFHTYIYQKPNVEIRFVKGRLKFQGAVNSAPFDSCVVIFWGCKM